jgi:hypothetical protein
VTDICSGWRMELCSNEVRNVISPAVKEVSQGRSASHAFQLKFTLPSLKVVVAFP